MTKPKKRSRFILFFSILVIVALLVAFGTKFAGGSLRRLVYLIGSGITGTAEEANIKFDFSSTNRFHAISGGFVVLSPNGVHIYDLSGREKSFTQLSYRSPSLSGSKTSVAAYDRNGQSYTILNSKKILFEGKCDAPIINLSLNDNGAFSLITAGPDCKALVTAYSSSAKELYKLYSTEQYILSAPISQNEKYMATLGFSAASGQFDGIVSFYKLNTEGAISSATFTDCMPISARFMQNGNLFVLFEDRVAVFSPDGKKITEHLFDGMTLKASALNSGKISSVLLNSYDNVGNTKLFIYDDTQSVSVNFEEEIFDISSSGNYTAVLFSDRITVYNKYGEVSSILPLAESVKECIVRDDGTVFAIGQNFANLLVP